MNFPHRKKSHHEACTCVMKLLLQKGRLTKSEAVNECLIYNKQAETVFLSLERAGRVTRSSTGGIILNEKYKEVVRDD